MDAEKVDFFFAVLDNQIIDGNRFYAVETAVHAYADVFFPPGELRRLRGATEPESTLPDAERMLKSMAPGVYEVIVKPDGKRIVANWLTTYHDPRTVTARVLRGMRFAVKSLGVAILGPILLPFWLLGWIDEKWRTVAN